MIDVIRQMFSMVWTLWNIFTFEVHYKAYQNREISAEYMPAVVQKSALSPIQNQSYILESDLIFSIFFSFLFFSVLFVLSSCSKSFLRLIFFMIVFAEFLVGRIIISYFNQQYIQLLILRVVRLSFVIISIFLLCLSCFCCQFRLPDFYKSTNKEPKQSKFSF